MPLVHSGGDAAFKTNVKNLMHEAKAGTSKHVKSREQALAIAYSIKRRGRALGGVSPAPWFVRKEAQSLGHTGPIASPVGGRTDHHQMSVPGGSYVVPADVVSGIGQGNTGNGHAILGRMFSGGPYGTGAPKMGGKPAFPKMSAPPKIAPHAFNPPAFSPTGLKAEGGIVVPFRADGGDVGDPTEIMAAGGEYVIPPEAVAQVGSGDVDRGHSVLDAWVLNERKKLIKTLKGLPGPARD